MVEQQENLLENKLITKAKNYQFQQSTFHGLMLTKIQSMNL